MFSLSFDEGVTISRIMSTELPHLAQILFSKDYDEIFNVATWNLETNIEHSMLEIEDDKSSILYNHMVKGLNSKLNYLVTWDAFYDLQYLLPFTFKKRD
jgi:hypothetical protein